MNEFYYKMLDEQGNLTGLLTCSSELGSDDRQVAITAEEYAALYTQIHEHNNLTTQNIHEGDDA